MTIDLAELERLANEHQLSVYEYRLLAFYMESDYSWTHSLREIGATCKMSPASCSSAIKTLMKIGLVDPYPGFTTKPGFVYLITDGTAHYKIGVATDVPKRLAELQTGNPRPLTIIATIQTADPIALETELHAKFADCHVLLEWFALSLADVVYIKGLAE